MPLVVPFIQTYLWSTTLQDFIYYAYTFYTGQRRYRNKVIYVGRCASASNYPPSSLPSNSLFRGLVPPWDGMGWPQGVRATRTRAWVPEERRGTQCRQGVRATHARAWVPEERWGTQCGARGSGDRWRRPTHSLRQDYREQWRQRTHAKELIDGLAARCTSHSYTSVGSRRAARNAMWSSRFWRPLKAANSQPEAGLSRMMMTKNTHKRACRLVSCIYVSTI